MDELVEAKVEVDEKKLEVDQRYLDEIEYWKNEAQRSFHMFAALVASFNGGVTVPDWALQYNYRILTDMTPEGRHFKAIVEKEPQ